MITNQKTINIKNNIIYLFNIIKFTKKENFLFIFPQQTFHNNKIFFRTLKEKKFNVLPKWPAGFITNFYQMCNSYKNISYFSFFFECDLSKVKFIVLDTIPSKNSTKYKEITLLKRILNINIISFINISETKDIDPIIDIPIFFNTSNTQHYSDKNFIYFTILNYLLK